MSGMPSGGAGCKKKVGMIKERRCCVRRQVKWVSLFVLVLTIGIAGCGMQTEMGTLTTHSNFVYPNSNVRVLGPAYAEVTKTSRQGMPILEYADLKKAYNQALASQPGANLLINYSQDTRITINSIPFFSKSTVTYELRGDAAKMVVGEQTLR
jgi:hypothetical protein